MPIRNDPLFINFQNKLKQRVLRWKARDKKPEINEYLFNDANLKSMIGEMAKAKAI